MTRESEIAGQLRAMGEMPVPPDDPRRTAARRARILDAMAEAAAGPPVSETFPSLSSARRPQEHSPGESDERAAALGPAQEGPRPAAARKRAALLLGGSAAAAAVVALGLGLGLRPRAPVLANHAGPAPALSSALGEAGAYVHGQAGGVVIIGSAGVTAAPPPDAPGQRLEPDDRVATLADGRATIHLGSIAVAALSANSELVVPRTSADAVASCELRSGTAHFDVAKLPPHTRFLVRTPDAEVTVHGTSFRVSVDAGASSDGPRTQVVVMDGVVSVRQEGKEVWLGAGERWPPAAPAPSDSTDRGPAAPSGKGPSPGTAPLAGRSGPPAGKSNLAAQNALLLDAAEARRRGDPSAEARALDTFIHRYPGSPGLHDAVVSRMRAAARGGDQAAASREAVRYLSLFPGGPLREEALAVIRRSGQP